MDTGPVLGVQREDVLPDDDAGSLGDRLARTGGHLLVAVLKELASGAARPIRQDESKATYAPKLEPGDRRLDWIEHAYLLERRVRALSPTPGAVTRFRGRVLKVLRARVEQDLVGEPGALAVLPDGFPRAATPKGSLVLLQVAAEGRSPMSGADWARGARILPLERLG
jgi:methionyl-tRNA formyltransferase